MAGEKVQRIALAPLFSLPNDCRFQTFLPARYNVQSHNGACKGTIPRLILRDQTPREDTRRRGEASQEGPQSDDMALVDPLFSCLLEGVAVLRKCVCTHGFQIPWRSMLTFLCLAQTQGLQ